MTILLDENVAHAMRHSLPGHNVVTVQYVGWKGTRNGELVARAEAAGFDLLITADKNIRYQQNLEGRRLAIIELSAQNWPIVRNHLSTIRAAVEAAVPGSFQFIDCGAFRRSRRGPEPDQC